MRQMWKTTPSAIQNADFPIRVYQWDAFLHCLMISSFWRAGSAPGAMYKVDFLVFSFALTSFGKIKKNLKAEAPSWE